MRKIDEMRQQLATLKAEVRTFLDQNKVTEAETKMTEVRNLEKSIKIQEELDAAEENNLENRSNKPVVNNTNNTEFRAISKYLLGKQMTDEERASVNIGNSGAILPQGFISTVETLIDGFPSLKQYCHVIPVTTTTGKMPISEGSTTRKLAKLATDTELIKEMMKLTPIEFSIDDYGKLIPIENAVLENAGVDFYNGVIAPDFAECSVNTENEVIIKVITDNAVNKTGTGTDHKQLVKVINKEVKPSLKKRTILLTNQSGYDYLDSLVDGQGRPLLTNSLSEDGAKKFKGLEVVVMDDEEVVASAGKNVFYIVNLYALVKYFDRKQYEIAVSKEAGFTYNQTIIRVLESFDMSKGDTRCCFKVEF